MSWPSPALQYPEAARIRLDPGQQASRGCQYAQSFVESGDEGLLYSCVVGRAWLAGDGWSTDGTHTGSTLLPSNSSRMPVRIATWSVPGYPRFL